MRLMKLGSVAVLICAAFTLTACGDNGNDESQRPQISAPATLSAGSLGVPYTASFVSQGNNIVWSVSGSPPPGLTLDPMTGQYTGTPTTIGSYMFTVTATNDFGMDTRSYSQDVNLPSSDTSALLSNNQLSAFPMAFPAGLEAPVDITGIVDGDTLVSIDRRPQNGFLYGLGYNDDAGTVRLYSISSNTAVATPIGAVGSFVAADGTTAVRIGADDDTVFGMDFNPTVDRVRVVNSIGQNFRMNPNNGALVDSDTTIAGTQMDGAINGPTTSLNETAYTNSAPSVTVTTQYGVDATIDAVCIQNPPNAGTQTMCAPLSVPVETVQGFDIPPSVRVTTSAAQATGSGVALVRASGRTQDEVVMIDLTSGNVTTAGPIGANGVVGIALQLPAAAPMVALSDDGSQLYRFLSTTPGTAAIVNVTNVTAGETLVGIDYRPQTGQLYALGVNATADAGTVYIVDPQGGAATVVGPTAGRVAFVDDSGAPVDLPQRSAGYGFDFNPTVDRIRVVTGTGLNFRVNPNDGNPVDGNLNNTASPPAGINTDGMLNGLPTGSTGATAAAYTNSFGQPLMGGVTTQYVIDPVSNTLFIQNPPNAGMVTAPQPITVNGNTLDFSEANGFDIPSTIRVMTSGNSASGLAFAALTVGSSTRLYSIELSNGRAINLGTLPGGVSGLAVGQTTIR